MNIDDTLDIEEMVEHYAIKCENEKKNGSYGGDIE